MANLTVLNYTTRGQPCTSGLASVKRVEQPHQGGMAQGAEYSLGRESIVACIEAFIFLKIKCIKNTGMFWVLLIKINRFISCNQKLYPDFPPINPQLGCSISDQSYA